MKKFFLVFLIACVPPTAPIEYVHTPPEQIPSDANAPIAQFNISCDNEICLFDAIDSHKTELPIKLYGWSFGDGSVYVTKETAVQHTYSEKGIYTVMLTVWDTQDRGGRLYKQFEIK